ncbi:MAG TPA: tetratricopeptide repeat protein [Myxococcota bacterium]|nr:tetratricopeptide repeat protein [Myxococcota bacterium]
MTRRLRFGVFALALALALAGAGTATPLDDALAKLRDGVAKHPDDPEVSWALASALEAAGRAHEALAAMRSHLARWPDRPGNGWAALGRCAYRAGRIDEAIDALQRATARDERDAEAQLYLGLALRARGEKERAEAHFEAAARDPELAPEALLLSGMSRIERGETDDGRARLERVVALAPRSDSAGDARALLEDSEPSRLPVSVEAYAGVEYDSNATLGGEGDLPGASSAQDDAAFEFGTDLAWRPPLGAESGRPLELGLHYRRLDYADQTKYSEQEIRGSLSGQTTVHPRLALRFDASGGYELLDNDPYLISGELRPSLLYALGPHAGVLHVYAVGARDEYEEDPFFDSLTRSDWIYGGGAEHLLKLGQERDAWLAWGGRYLRRDTDAGRDALGFRPAYDADMWQGSLRAALSLPFQIRARAELFFDAELYDHRNLIDALTEGPESVARRRDFVWSTALSLRRPLYRSVELELHAEFTDRDSNVDLYSYQRALTGLRLRAAFP